MFRQNYILQDFHSTIVTMTTEKDFPAAKLFQNEFKVTSNEARPIPRGFQHKDEIDLSPNCQISELSLPQPISSKF